jgi:hypothetical protein
MGVEHCRYPIETEVGIFPENAVDKGKKQGVVKLT